MAKRRKVGNLLALSLLTLLAQHPMYPYEMAQTLRARGKDTELHDQLGLALHGRGQPGQVRVHRGGRHRPRGQAARADHLPDHRARHGRAQGLADGAAERARGRAQRIRRGAVRGGHPAPRRGDRPAHRPARHPRQGQRRPPGRPQACGPSGCPASFWSSPSTSSPCGSPSRSGSAACSTELVEGTISGVDAWRRMHETGEIRRSSRSWTSRRRRGWDETPPATSMTSRHNTTPVHGAGTPRTGVATSPPALRLGRTRRS